MLPRYSYTLLVLGSLAMWDLQTVWNVQQSLVVKVVPEGQSDGYNSNKNGTVGAWDTHSKKADPSKRIQEVVAAAEEPLNNREKQEAARKAPTELPTDPPTKAPVTTAPTEFPTRAPVGAAATQKEATEIIHVSSSTVACPNLEYTKGKWVQNGVNPKNGDPIYKWQVQDPTSCQLEDPSIDVFCKALNGRNIMIVGDSINSQLFEALRKFLKGKGYKKEGFRGRFQTKARAVVCGGNSKIAYFRNDRLKLNTKLEGNLNTKTAQSHQPWIPLLHQYQVLVLNTGTHVPSVDNPLEEHRHTLQAAKEYLLSKQYDGLALFRTSPRGHIGCAKTDTKPIESEAEENWERFFGPKMTQHNHQYISYKYGILPQQNNIYRELFPDSQLLDVARMTELRPDGHLKPPGDCLHYAKEDEVMGSWAWLLQNALQGKFGNSTTVAGEGTIVSSESDPNQALATEADSAPKEEEDDPSEATNKDRGSPKDETTDQENEKTETTASDQDENKGSKSTAGTSDASCPNFQYTKGKWVESSIDKKTGKPVYKWQVEDPNKCQLEDFSRDSFCKALGGRNILIVGDSLNLQMYEAMKKMLKGKQEKKDWFKVGHLQTGGHVTICGGSMLSMIRNDHLKVNHVLLGNPNHKTVHHSKPWVAKLRDYQVLVFNTGAHVPKENAIEAHRESLEGVKSYLSNVNYTGEVYYRTVPRGHIGCLNNDTKPIESEADPDWERFFGKTMTEENKKYISYQYGVMPEQNKMYHELFPASQLLDVTRMTELRPDGHLKPKKEDCLHYAKDVEIIGAWVWLFQNGLQGHL